MGLIELGQTIANLQRLEQKHVNRVIAKAVRLEQALVGGSSKLSSGETITTSTLPSIPPSLWGELLTSQIDPAEIVELNALRNRGYLAGPLTIFDQSSYFPLVVDGYEACVQLPRLKKRLDGRVGITPHFKVHFRLDGKPVAWPKGLTVFDGLRKTVRIKEAEDKVAKIVHFVPDLAKA